MEVAEGSSQEDLTQCSQSQSVLKEVGASSQTGVFAVPSSREQRPSRKGSGDAHKASRSRSRSRDRPSRPSSLEQSKGRGRRETPSPSSAMHSGLPSVVPLTPRKGHR